MKNLEHLPELEMEEEKKTQRHREAGMGKNGEPSMEALKNWFRSEERRVGKECL